MDETKHSPQTQPMPIGEIRTLAVALRDNISKVINGKEEVIDLVLTALFASGHLLLEDMPGTGKTTLAKALAKSIDADFSRVQFTPDILPSDLTGINFFDQKKSGFCIPAGTHLHQHSVGGRNQPHHSPYPVQFAGMPWRKARLRWMG